VFFEVYLMDRLPCFMDIIFLYGKKGFRSRKMDLKKRGAGTFLDANEHRYFSLREIGNRHKRTPHPCINGCGVLVFE